MRKQALEDFTFISNSKYLAVTYNEHHIHDLNEERFFSRSKWNNSRIRKANHRNKKQTKYAAAAAPIEEVRYVS